MHNSIATTTILRDLQLTQIQDRVRALALRIDPEQIEMQEAVIRRSPLTEMILNQKPDVGVALIQVPGIKEKVNIAQHIASYLPTIEDLTPLHVQEAMMLQPNLKVINREYVSDSNLLKVALIIQGIKANNSNHFTANNYFIENIKEERLEHIKDMKALLDENSNMNSKF